jgi:hypothetical protein
MYNYPLPIPSVLLLQVNVSGNHLPLYTGRAGIDRPPVNYFIPCKALLCQSSLVPDEDHLKGLVQRSLVIKAYKGVFLCIVIKCIC